MVDNVVVVVIIVMVFVFVVALTVVVMIFLAVQHCKEFVVDSKSGKISKHRL